jgi:hypothetical protein
VPNVCCIQLQHVFICIFFVLFFLSVKKRLLVNVDKSTFLPYLNLSREAS